MGYLYNDMVGEYHWQKGRKLALLAWEMSKQHGETV